MSLSIKHLNTNPEAVPFDINAVRHRLQNALPEISFALLLGSAQGGVVKARSDFDLALYLQPYKPTLGLYAAIDDALADLLSDVRIDTGFLNQAEPVYRFEALKGTLLFARDRDLYARFFSLTCREYESQMASYKRQLKYRKQAKHALQRNYQ
ncbi:MAG: nucleotidyltransferase domain-containing protein [Kiritimatiellia bacterium]